VTAVAAVRIGELLDELAATLGGPGLPPDRGTARDIIAAVVSQPRFWPTANRDAELDGVQVERARDAAAAIRSGAPFAYAVGTAAFRGLTLRVDRRVLIPRPETEVLVDLALALTNRQGTVADVCTGSGAIALALASEGAYTRVVATDVSAEALAVAADNLGTLDPTRQATVEFRRGDLCAPLSGERFGLVVANPPYIADGEAGELPRGVFDWEPHLALFSGPDGIAAIQRLIADVPEVLEAGGVMILETDSRRAAAALALASADARWVDSQLHNDLTGRQRFLVARRSRSG